MTKAIAIMQPYFIPYIGYFQLINMVDKFIVYPKVNYRSRSWFSRNTLQLDNSRTFLSPSLENQSNQLWIEDVYVASDLKWRKYLLRRIQLSYARAPYAQRIFPILGKIFYNMSPTLDKFNYNALALICDYLGIRTPIELGNNTRFNSFESSIREEKSKSARCSKRVVTLCKFYSASVFVNPISGRELYSEDHLSSCNIAFKLFCVDEQIVQSIFESQDNHTFSIIHLMMHYSRSRIRDALLSYQSTSFSLNN